MEFQTERLVLRPWQESDAEELYKYASDPDIGLSAGWKPHIDVENSREIILNVLCKPETYAICLKESEKAIGSIGFHHNDLFPDEYELGYWIGKPFWGQGFVPEASRELLRYAFENLDMNRIWCAYFEGNAKSRRVQEKLGFEYHHTTEGVRIKQLGEFRTAHFSLLTKERYFSL